MPDYNSHKEWVHKEYIQHLYELFSSYCGMVPKTSSQSPNKRTGKIYHSVGFKTYSLPCFNSLYDLFYSEGKQIVPLNIGELLTPLGLCYWIRMMVVFARETRQLY